MNEPLGLLTVCVQRGFHGAGLVQQRRHLRALLRNTAALCERVKRCSFMGCLAGSFLLWGTVDDLKCWTLKQCATHLNPSADTHTNNTDTHTNTHATYVWMFKNVLWKSLVLCWQGCGCNVSFVLCPYKAASHFYFASLAKQLDFLGMFHLIEVLSTGSSGQRCWKWDSSKM